MANNRKKATEALRPVKRVSLLQLTVVARFIFSTILKGVKVVVEESYARIFFRNSVAMNVLLLESKGRLCDECSTGDVVTVELAENLLINHTTGKEYKLKPIGDAGSIIDAGGIFT
ncbi:hypothetical protein IFM89_016510 [Coptis chinensis]|uniref:Aconitase A/isopropylmalate dehydratase small subunit swivel domain-containing protein n=1 Tax=Coptis chinensis TaxID=261450 RepID=A0A835IBR8_9MAGN|nr:hypothetical protein IFM89_016510 [Coptis chinensis]